MFPCLHLDVNIQSDIFRFGLCANKKKPEIYFKTLAYFCIIYYFVINYKHVFLSFLIATFSYYTVNKRGDLQLVLVIFDNRFFH